MIDPSFKGPVVLAGHFDPATVARMLPRPLAEKIAGLRRAPGVPIHSLAQSLIARGIGTTLLGGIRNSERIYLKADPLGVAIYPKRGGAQFILSGLRRERRQVLEFLELIQPRIVHAHWTFEAGRAVGDWRGPKVLTVHDAAWEYSTISPSLHPFSLAYTARWLKMTAETLKRYKHVIAVSPYLEAYLRLKHRFRGEIRVIPNILPELPQEFVAPKDLPKSGEITFGCYGDPKGLKNTRVAIDAFKIFRSHFPASRLLVFGHTGGQSGQQRQDPGVEFRGAIPHRDFLRTLVELIDVWVHPALLEAHPLSICEAIQAGCPVIAGATSGGVAWTLDYGKAGLLVDIHNPEDVAKAMGTVVLDWTESKRMVEYGQQFVRAKFNAERVLGLHLDYYRDIIADFEQSSES